MADAEDSALIQSQLDRLFDTHQRIDRSFAIWLYAPMLAGVAFLVLIAMPYAQFFDAHRTLGRDGDAAEAAVESLKRSETEVVAKLRDYDGVRQSWRELLEQMSDVGVIDRLVDGKEEQAARVAEMKRDVMDFVGTDYEPLQDWLSGRAKAPPDMPDDPGNMRMLNAYLYKHIARDPCAALVGADWQYCLYAKGLSHSRERIEAFVIPLAQDAAIGPQAAAAFAHFDEVLAFLKGQARLDGKVRPAEVRRVRSALQPLSREMEALVQTVGRTLRERRQTLSTGLAAAKARAFDIAAERAQTAEKLDRINSFDRLQTPLGDLPVTLNALVLTLPPALLATFVYAVTLLQRGLKTRAQIARLYRFQDHAVFSDETLALLAPVWLDPRDGWGRRGVRLALLGVVPALAIGSAAAFAWLGVLREAVVDFPGGLSGVVVVYSIAVLAAAAATLALVRDTRRTARDNAG